MNTINDIHQNRPARNGSTDAEDAVQSDTTGAAAASGDLWAGYAAVPQGKCWLEFEAVTTNCHFRLCRTATTATTAANGTCLIVGVPRRFYVDPTKDLFIDHLATGAGTVKWRRVGHICERSQQ